MAATDQIRQMVNFILQEAHEKANEIRVKVGRVEATDLASNDSTLRLRLCVVIACSKTVFFISRTASIDVHPSVCGQL